MTPLALLAAATFLTMVPVTLLVPGLPELVREAVGGTRFHAHAFMAINMLTGMIGIPLVMLGVRRKPGIGPWLSGLLVADAVLFSSMGLARDVTWLFLLRALEGAVHLPAVTLLMVGASRAGGERKGAALGALAGALMIGVSVGAPLGGWLVGFGPAVVYLAGGAMLATASVVAAVASVHVPVVPPRSGSRYAWDRRAAAAWMPLVLGFSDRFAIGVFVSTFTLYLSEVAGYSPAGRGLLVSLFMVPFAALCLPTGRLADRSGWLVPVVGGTVGFGLVFAAYGIVPAGWLPAAMVASGVLSALMYPPNLVLVAEMARRGAGEGLFGAFQVAGSLGFLVGPIAGGGLLELTRAVSGEVAYAAVFTMVGAFEAAGGVVAWFVLRPLAREWSAERDAGSAGALAAS